MTATTPPGPDVTQVLDNARRAARAGDFAGARRACEHFLSLHPDAADVLNLLVEFDMRDGCTASARQRLERVVALRPYAIEPRETLSRVLEELGDADALVTFARAWAERMPDLASAWARLAWALQATGRMEEAIAIYQTYIGRWPNDVSGYAGLVTLNSSAIDDAMIATLERFARAGTPGERVRANFALGQVLERRADYDAAFARFAEGNRLRRENPSLDTAPSAFSPGGVPEFTSVEEAERAQATFVREAINTYTPNFLARFAGGGHPSPLPIFIVGLPRTGSTLLEQILSSHPQVQGLGEAPVLSTVFRRALHAAQRNAAEGDPATFFRRVGAAYLQALQERGWDGRRKPIDKMLGNYVYAGTIHLALPNATILHSVRDAVDTCFSAFRLHFGNRNEVSYDLAALGRHYVRYREMIAHWEKVLPGRLITIENERLVADPAGEIPKLVAACGLPWDDACLRFEETTRVVRTASVAQVRKPISSAGVQRWRNYERHLGPLFAALGPYAPK